MTSAPEQNAEPEWVKLLRARGFEVDGGEGGELPFDPPAEFYAWAPRRRCPGLRMVLGWIPGLRPNWADGARRRAR